MENQKATLEPWLKEFEKRFIGYEKVSGGIGLSYVTDVDNPYLKNDISGIKDFIQETLSNREKEIAEEVEKKRKEPTHSGTGSISWYNQALDEVLLIMKK